MASSRFSSNSEKEEPTISTASLPDIVFMLIFFFMVSTVFREEEVKVKIIPPTASEVAKLENKTLVGYVNVGPPMEKYQAQFGTAPKLQLNDKLVDVESVQNFVAMERGALNPEEVFGYTVSIKGDKDLDLDIIEKIKMELRKQNQFRVNYSASQGDIQTNFQ